MGARVGLFVEVGGMEGTGFPDFFFSSCFSALSSVGSSSFLALSFSGVDALSLKRKSFSGCIFSSITHLEILI